MKNKIKQEINTNYYYSLWYGFLGILLVIISLFILFKSLILFIMVILIGVNYLFIALNFHTRKLELLNIEELINIRWKNKN